MAIWNDYTGLQTLATGGSPALFLGGGPSGGAYGRFDVGDFLQIQAYQEGYFSVDTGADFCIEYMCRESSGENGIALAVNEGNWPIDERRIWGNGEWCVWGGARFVWVGDSVVRVSAAVSIDDGAWHSVALDRSGGMLRVFVDGVQCSLLLNGAAAGTEVEFGGALSGAPGHAFFIGNCYFEYQPLVIYENHPYGGDLAWVRFTRASREASGFMMPSAAPPITAADPQWSNTTLMAGVMLEDGDAGGGGSGGGGGWQTAVPVRSHDELLRRLLPPVSIDRNGPVIGVEMDAYGAALDLAEAVAGLLLVEADPRTAAGMLADWERVYGLDAGTQSAAERRSALLAVILSAGGQSAAFYAQLAAAAGWTATIHEFQPHTVESDVEYPLYGEAWLWVWQVRAHANVGAIGQAPFEALIRRLAPAHTAVIFEYY